MGDTSGVGRFHRGDSVRHADHAAGALDMEVFDQPAIHHDHAFTARRRRRMGLDDAPRPGDILRFGRKYLVAGTDLLRMDEGLTVEAELLTLFAGRFAGLTAPVSQKACHYCV